MLVSDADNHASMIAGIRHSMTEKAVFAHNDLEDLEGKLQAIDIDRPKVVVFESVYSMDGDISPINAICDLADKYNAMTYLDEVHAVGMYGPAARVSPNETARWTGSPSSREPSPRRSASLADTLPGRRR